MFEVELSTESAETIDRFDMHLFDEACDHLWEENDVTHTFNYERMYFSGDMSKHAIWEIASDRKAVAVRDLTE